MPNGTEDQVGFFVPQSKHTWSHLAPIHSQALRIGDDILCSQASSSASQKSFAIVLLLQRSSWYCIRQ